MRRFVDRQEGAAYHQAIAWQDHQNLTVSVKGASDMFDILMICTGNICRSPMAEGLLRHMLPATLKPHVRVSSAGTYAMHGNRPAPHAITVMARLGIDISAHRARMVSRELIRQSDLSLVMERNHLKMLRNMLLFNKANAKLLTAFSPDSGQTDMDVDDPYGGPIEMYQASLDTLRPALEGLIGWLLEQPGIAEK